MATLPHRAAALLAPRPAPPPGPPGALPPHGSPLVRLGPAVPRGSPRCRHPARPMGLGPGFENCPFAVGKVVVPSPQNGDGRKLHLPACLARPPVLAVDWPLRERSPRRRPPLCPSAVGFPLLRACLLPPRGVRWCRRGALGRAPPAGGGGTAGSRVRRRWRRRRWWRRKFIAEGGAEGSPAPCEPAGTHVSGLPEEAGGSSRAVVPRSLCPARSPRPRAVGIAAGPVRPAAAGPAGCECESERERQ